MAGYEFVRTERKSLGYILLSILGGRKRIINGLEQFADIQGVIWGLWKNCLSFTTPNNEKLDFQ